MEARLEGAVLAALDATAVDPALGRAVISVMRLRAHLSALPSPELHDFASSQVAPVQPVHAYFLPRCDAYRRQGVQDSLFGQ
jgi:hypothetical protein